MLKLIGQPNFYSVTLENKTKFVYAKYINVFCTITMILNVQYQFRNDFYRYVKYGIDTKDESMTTSAAIRAEEMSYK